VQAFLAMNAALMAPKSRNSLLISLLAGNYCPETGSYLTAHTTIQSFHSA